MVIINLYLEPRCEEWNYSATIYIQIYVNKIYMCN